MGTPNLYDLKLQFLQFDRPIDEKSQRFGVRTIAQGRDDDEGFPALGKGGNFYLTVNGKDFLVRGATYTPDLLYRYDPDREDAILAYVRDLGLNMLRLESKIPTERFVEAADELGIPLMVGWMCCNQWEKWPQWDEEDRRVAYDSTRSQVAMLRSHAAAVVWANGSDGRPPEQVLSNYHSILEDLHWQNAVVDTVSSYLTRCKRRTRLGRHPDGGARTRGVRRRTGSADAMAPRGDRLPSRATTSTFHRSPV